MYKRVVLAVINYPWFQMKETRIVTSSRRTKKMIEYFKRVIVSANSLNGSVTAKEMPLMKYLPPVQSFRIPNPNLFAVHLALLATAIDICINYFQGLIRASILCRKVYMGFIHTYEQLWELVRYETLQR